MFRLKLVKKNVISLHIYDGKFFSCSNEYNKLWSLHYHKVSNKYSVTFFTRTDTTWEIKNVGKPYHNANTIEETATLQNWDIVDTFEQAEENIKNYENGREIKRINNTVTTWQY